MEKVHKKYQVATSRQKAFSNFVNEINNWWPKEYTWSDQNLQKIKIDGRENGLCTEIGPHGFRCDWGRVIGIDEDKNILLKWQIGPQRVPEPNPEKSSTLSISFENNPENQSTSVIVEHFDFENHGNGADSYQEAMNSEQGWDYIFDRYIQYCKQQDK